MAATPEGRQLPVKWDTTCPSCGKALTKGEISWYIHKNKSKSGKSELFCSKAHAEAHYGGATPAPVAPEPINIVEECGAKSPAPVYVCTEPKGHEGNHHARNTKGELQHSWSQAKVGDPIPPTPAVPEGDPLVGCSTQDVVRIAKDLDTIQANELAAHYGGVVDEIVQAKLDAFGEYVTEAITKVQTIELTVNNAADTTSITLGAGAFHKQLPLVLQCLEADVNVFLVGPAGTGKSTLARQAAEVTGRGFSAISFGPTTPTSKLFGYGDANGNHVRTPLRECWDAGDLFLGDELDNGHAGLTAELNQLLANGHAAFSDGVHERHPGFRFIATGNTFGKGGDRLFVGRNQLDAATLDRFVTIPVEVDEDLERQLALSQCPSHPEEAAAWLAEVVEYRNRASELRLPLVISPRASIDGCKLLQAGVDLDLVREIRLVAGWDLDTRNKVGVRS